MFWSSFQKILQESASNVHFWLNVENIWNENHLMQHQVRESMQI